MDLDFSDEQLALRDLVRDVCANASPIDVVRAMEDDPRGYPDALWKQLAEVGVLGIRVPEAYGGAGQGLLETAIAYEELGRALAPTPHLPSCVWAAGVLARAGSEEQKRAWLPRIANGDAVLAPAGDISVSIRGYAAFLRQQLRGRRGLDPSRDAAFYRHLHHAIEFGSEYSLGWYWVDQFDDEVSSHTGSADTFYCSCIVLPGHDIAIAVVANAATDGAREAVTHVRNFLLRPYVSGSTR